jgi:hypothetical protein
MSAVVPDFEPLSLQGKLDRIAHERAVLALARELAGHGLLEGALVRATTDGSELRGRIEIARESSPPRARVRLDDGRLHDYERHRWQPL